MRVFAYAGTPRRRYRSTLATDAWRRRWLGVVLSSVERARGGVPARYRRVERTQRRDGRDVDMSFRRSSGSDSSVAMLFVVAAILAVGPSTAASRAVNISSTWFLPQEGFPVFYRYFRDRITWFEADAVCQFHHANLVTVDTSVQYDATRAYLKELDIVNNVWIGLKKPASADDFAWTDSKTLTNEGGYWQEQIPKSSSPLCAATDPAADFRWHSLNCGGPEVASFICEMPVPAWAHQDGGCMLTSLPSLTVIFLPEQSAIELTSDCGLDGTRRIACKGEANREEMMKQLSCTHGGVTQDDEVGSVSPDVTSSSSSATSFSSSSSSSGSYFSSSSTGSTGTRSWTGHHQTPTRHRRDADVDQVASSQMISLIKSTTAVAEETTARVTTVNNVIALKTGTESLSSSDASTATATDEDYATEATTNLPLEFQENATTGSNATTNLEPQLSTMGEKPLPPTAGLAVGTEIPDDDILDGGVFSQFKEMRVIVENLSTQDVKETSTSEPITTINVLSPSSEVVNTNQMEATATEMPTAAAVLSTGTTLGNAVERETFVVQNSTETGMKNATEDSTPPSTVRATVVMATTNQPKTIISETTAETTVNTPDNNDEVAYLIMQERNQKTSDEINSREEDEEERLKEEERKEKEKRFKEEEENRRRLFLPTPLRNMPEPESESTSKPPVPLVMEDPYEEPAEMIEPEPEVPSRPNRGRRLTRPQTHSFYPYFLNRVLG